MRYAVQRLTRFLIVFFIVTFGVMVLLRLGLDRPGDPARTMLGGFATEEQIDATTAKFHLDENYLVQYFHWLRLIVFERRLRLLGVEQHRRQLADQPADHDDRCCSGSTP